MKHSEVEANIKSWERLKKTGIYKYVFFNSLLFSLPLWIIIGLTKRSNKTPFQQIYFSDDGLLSLLYWILAGLLYSFLTWFFYKYLYKKAISKQSGKSNS